MKGEKDSSQAGNAWKIHSVNSGANPDEFEFPDAIPQTVEKGNATHRMFERFFKQHDGTDH